MSRYTKAERKKLSKSFSDGLIQLSDSDGKGLPIYRWGTIFFYTNYGGLKGKYYKWKKDKVVYKKKTKWRLWQSTQYDQIDKLMNTTTAEEKKLLEEIDVENIDNVIAIYQKNGWSDVVEVLARFARVGIVVRLLVKDDNNFIKLVNAFEAYIPM